MRALPPQTKRPRMGARSKANRLHEMQLRNDTRNHNIATSMTNKTKIKKPTLINSKPPEIVICAAVIGVDGRVIRCHRHNHGIAVLAELKVKLRPDHDAQGFITSKNRYVNRKEGLQLQLAAGIPSADIGGYGKELFSEDLY